MANNSTLYIGGAALLALLLFSGKASAKPGKFDPKPGVEPPLPGEEPAADEDEIILLPDEPVSEDEVEILDDDPTPVTPANFGVTPQKFLIPFATAESATQGALPGLARYMAIRAWSARRAMQLPYFATLEEAQAFASKYPDLCLKCHNKSASERNASCRGIERVTFPKGQKGPCGGTGAYEKTWPVSPYNTEWKDFGSAGLFDILSSSALYAGIHEGFTPLLSRPPDVLFDARIQMYVLGVNVYRVVSGPYEVLSATPRETWTKIHRVISTGSLKDTVENVNVGIRFQNRAKELGIDLDTFPNLSGGGMPTLDRIKLWPGAQAYSDGLATAQVNA